MEPVDGPRPPGASVPNRIRSAWRRKNARAVYGWRPSSAEPGRDVDEEVRVRVEHPRDQPEVLGRTADVGPDERRRGMPPDEPVERTPGARRTAGTRGRPAWPGGRVGQKCQSGCSVSSS